MWNVKNVNKMWRNVKKMWGKDEKRKKWERRGYDSWKIMKKIWLMKKIMIKRLWKKNYDSWEEKIKKERKKVILQKQK